MQTLRMTERTGKDGVLHVRIPLGAPEADFDVVLVVQAEGDRAPPPTPEGLGWPPGYFDKTFGSITDETFSARRKANCLSRWSWTDAVSARLQRLHRLSARAETFGSAAAGDNILPERLPVLGGQSGTHLRCVASTDPAANRARVETFTQPYRSLPFDDAAAEHFATIRRHLETLGTTIGPYDLQIAAIALAHGCTLVTHNTEEFSRVPGVLLEDWEV